MPTPPGFTLRTGTAIMLGDRVMTFIADDEGLFHRAVDSIKGESRHMAGRGGGGSG